MKIATALSAAYIALFCSPYCTARELSVRDVLSGNHDYEKAEFSGTVVDVFDDETDATHVFLSVRQDGENLLVPVNDAKERYGELRKLVGARIRVRGHCDASVQWNMRRHMGRRFDVASPDDITVLEKAPDLFDVPDAILLDPLRPDEITSAGRHRARGKVLAVWDMTNVLILTPSNRLVRLQLADREAPSFGDSIEAVGFPGTDLYHINLSRARWRKTALRTIPRETVRAITMRDLFEDLPSGRPIFQEKLYGKTVRLQGRVKDSPRDGRMKLEDGPFVLTLDVGALGDDARGPLEPGAVLDVTGSCIMDAGNWRPHAPFPKITEVILVLRTPQDIVILAEPPWWTPKRMLALIIALAGMLLAFFVWNRVLQKIVERRGRELFREQVSHVCANLRTRERTRLAIELHDSISQNLTGIALELKAVESAAGTDLPTALSHLAIAERSIASCHTELRNCLWDLRHGALETLDMNDAIRQCVLPQIGDVDLTVRFRVPRRRLTDNTAYAILKITRELATNAVRHGNATAVKIAGAIDAGQLRFSVTDNGSGFDPQSAPGPAEGHYGLLGVTERIANLEGGIDIDSAPGRGTKVTISLNLPHEKDFTDAEA